MKLLAALLAATLFCSASARAEEPEPPPRPFLSSTWDGIKDFGGSPLRLSLSDSAWLVPAAVGAGVLVNNDVPLYHALATGDARKEWLDHSMPALTTLGDGLIEFSLAAVASKVGDARLQRTSATAMQGLAVVAVYAEIFKLAAWSNRPYQDDSQHRYWAYDQDTQGMPSGHSFSAFCAAEVYGAEYGRLLPYSLAGLVAYSRIYNQAHWPTDVWVGSILGIVEGVQARHAAAAHGAPSIRFGMAQRQNAPLLVANVAF